MPRVLVTGAAGQVGRELVTLLGDDPSVFFTDIIDMQGVKNFQTLDLTKPELVLRAFKDWRPEVVVNAAAYTAVDRAEDQRDEAFALNARVPEILSEVLYEQSGGLIHYSTDYVFDGSGKDPWSEDDTTGPLNVYGLSKLKGEEAIRQKQIPHLILRTQWVFSPYGNNFVKSMLRLGSERDTLSIVDDQFGAPTSARFLASVASGLARNPEQIKGKTGTYHVASSGETTWCGFAREIFRQAQGLGVELKIDSVSAISSEAYPTAATRPKNSRLNCAKLTSTFGLEQPRWQDALLATLGALIIPP